MTSDFWVDEVGESIFSLIVYTLLELTISRALGGFQIVFYEQECYSSYQIADCRIDVDHVAVLPEHVLHRCRDLIAVFLFFVQCGLNFGQWHQAKNHKIGFECCFIALQDLEFVDHFAVMMKVVPNAL